MLAKHVAQVFCVPDTTNKRLMMIMLGKRQIVGVQNVINEEEFDQFDEILLSSSRWSSPKYHWPMKLHSCATTTMKKSRLSKNQDRNRK
jgi:hypothetical protein